ncbi:MAG: FIST C-terminal domain-containing protein, partial [Candidatus Omnitrophica bacterium]|nr:FIST C-terminal domain-containing protein [Candidatus Omnitrophota bacterium]
EKEAEEAIKEVSLKIKRIFPKKIYCLIVLFTPGYSPAQILKTINFTLNPEKLFGLQAPWLIFEDKTLSKGIVVCCINKNELFLHEASLEAKKSEEIESFFHTAFKNIRKKDYFFLSFLSPAINPSQYLNGLKLSMGEVFGLLGAGYMKKYAANSYQIVNNNIEEGMAAIALKGLDVYFLQLGGYVPLGKPFTITKIIPSRNLIMEINGNPAVEIYRYYAEEKYNDFMKKKIFSLYPLGIKKNGSLQLVNVIEYLQDGSLMYTGELKEGSQAHMMFLDTTSLFNDARAGLLSLQRKGQGLVFIVNSLSRKNILKDLAVEEIRFIKQTLGKESKIIGIYSDYALSNNQEKGFVDLETGNILLTLWD